MNPQELAPGMKLEASDIQYEIIAVIPPDPNGPWHRFARNDWIVKVKDSSGREFTISENQLDWYKVMGENRSAP